MNKVLLTGRLTKDPKFNSYNGGEDGFTNFVLAVTRPNTKNEITDFFSCIAWKEKAKFINQYIHKGDLVAITGVLQTRQYETAQKTKQVMTEIYIEQIDLCATVSNKQPKQEEQNNEAFGNEQEIYYPPF